MKKIFRKNQVIITALAIMIAVAGYLNYAGKEELSNTASIQNEKDIVNEAGILDISDEDILAENKALADAGQPVDSAEGTAQAAETIADTEGQPVSGDINSLDLDLNSAADTSIDNPGEAVLTNGVTVSDYIANVQLSREQVRAKNKETLLGLINNTNIEDSQKQQAIQNMIDLTAIAEKENAAETLLMAKGFSNPVVSITDGKVDVVINASTVTDPQRAQIEDIVKRKTEVSAENIIITLLSLSE